MNSGLKALSHSGSLVLYRAHPQIKRLVAYQDTPADPHDGKRGQISDSAMDNIANVSLGASKNSGNLNQR